MKYFWLIFVFVSEIFAADAIEILQNFKLNSQNFNENELKDENLNPDFDKISQILKQNKRFYIFDEISQNTEISDKNKTKDKNLVSDENQTDFDKKSVHFSSEDYIYEPKNIGGESLDGEIIENHFSWPQKKIIENKINFNNENEIKMHFVSNIKAPILLKSIEFLMQKSENSDYKITELNYSKTPFVGVSIGLKNLGENNATLKNIQANEQIAEILSKFYKISKDNGIFIKNFYCNAEKSYVFELDLNQVSLNTATQKENFFKNKKNVFLNVSDYFFVDIIPKQKTKLEVIFFDKFLNIIYEKKSNKPVLSFKQKMPKNTYYLQICNNEKPQNLKNLKVKFN